MKKALQELMTWVANYLREHPLASAPETARAAADEWYRRGPEAMHELLECTLSRTIYSLTLDVFAATRGVSKGLESRGAGGVSSLVRRILSGQEQSMEELRQKFEIWREHAGDKHYPLMDMTRGQLVVAAMERRKRADTELGRAKFLEGLAARLGEGEKVRDKWSPVEMWELLRKCEGEKAVG